jgi:uncharacterized membrane protein
MSTTRLEAFSDAVVAIIITIMVLEMKAPHSSDWEALREIGPVFGSYVMSYVYLGIYWNNHHHLLHATSHVTGRVLWANLFLLFWLSLIPFTTAWMGENHFTSAPTALYGIVLIMAALAYYLLQSVIIAADGENSAVRRAIGKDRKGKLSPIAYALAIGLSFVLPQASLALYVLVALIWLVPDSRIEKLSGE